MKNMHIFNVISVVIIDITSANSQFCSLDCLLIFLVNPAGRLKESSIFFPFVTKKFMLKSIIVILFCISYISFKNSCCLSLITYYYYFH